LFVDWIKRHDVYRRNSFQDTFKELARYVSV
jgi:hypothetical protein